MSGRTRLLGVDHGNVRIGLAVSDAGRRIASPLSTYTRCDSQRDAAFFRELITREEIGGIVLGLPVHLSGHEGQSANTARAFARWLAETTALPINFADERFTTVEAEDALWQAGLSHKKRDARRARVAAQILLQAYLDAGCPPEETPGDIAD